MTSDSIGTPNHLTVDDVDNTIYRLNHIEGVERLRR